VREQAKFACEFVCVCLCVCAKLVVDDISVRFEYSSRGLGDTPSATIRPITSTLGFSPAG
jgi:hypothetical protein